MCNICGFYLLRELYEPISTNPGSMEEGEYGLMRGTYFVARRLEVIAVVGMLLIVVCFRCDGVYFVFFTMILHFQTRS